MDQYQTVEREKTINNAISSAIRYLDRYPRRTVSLMLSNTLVVSRIKRLERNATQVTAIVESEYPMGGGKAVTVSFHDITAVSEDQIDLVTDETVVDRSRDILDFIQTKYDDGYATPFFKKIRDRLEEELILIGEQKLEDLNDEMKASFNSTVRARVLDAASDLVAMAYRSYCDFFDMRERALMEVGLGEFISPREKTIRDIKAEMSLGKPR